MDSLKREEISVDVDGETVRHCVFVDNETGLDVDSHTGKFSTRMETEETVREVYRVGRQSLKSDMEKYNRWLQGSSAKVTSQKKLLQKPAAGQVSPSPSPKSVVKPMSPAEKSAAALDLKDAGNQALRNKDLRRAVKLYSEGIALQPNSTLFSNRSEAYLRLRRFDDAGNDASEALLLDSANEKARYRKTVALLAQHKNADALKILSAAPQTAEWDALRKQVDDSDRMRLSESSKRFVATADISEGSTLGSLPIALQNVAEGVLKSWKTASEAARKSLDDYCRQKRAHPKFGIEEESTQLCAQALEVEHPQEAIVAAAIAKAHTQPCGLRLDGVVVWCPSLDFFDCDAPSPNAVLSADESRSVVKVQAKRAIAAGETVVVGCAGREHVSP